MHLVVQSGDDAVIQSDKSISKYYFILVSSLSAYDHCLSCINEGRTVNFLTLHQVPYTVTQPCVGVAVLQVL